MTKHPYATIIQAISNSESVEFYNSDNQWVTQPDALALNEISRKLYPPSRYRVKPKLIRIGNYDVPEPVRQPIDEDIYYYTPCTSFADGYDRLLWEGSEFDLRQLENGQIHLTKEAAVLHAKALLSLTKPK